MAEIVKSKEKKNLVKEEKTKKTDKLEKNVERMQKDEDNKNLWEKLRIFFNGVKSETKKVRWTSKGDMIKYSIATIVFMVFCSVFFYVIDTLFALVQTLFK